MTDFYPLPMLAGVCPRLDSLITVQLPPPPVRLFLLSDVSTLLLTINENIGQFSLIWVKVRGEGLVGFTLRDKFEESVVGR